MTQDSADPASGSPAGRLPAQRIPPIAFAHRGARADARENTIEAFRLALQMGATGLESDVWTTADGEVVLDHNGVVGRWPLRRALRRKNLSQLPAHIPTLHALYETCGTDFELSLDVKDEAAFDRVIEVAKAAGSDALERLWLCHPDWQVVAGWRRLLMTQPTQGAADQVRLVDSTRLRAIKEGPERRAARLAEAGIDAINLHQSDWSGGLTTLFHRFGILAFGWDAQLPRIIDELLERGIDGIYSDHVDRLSEAVAHAYPGHHPPK